MGCIIEFIIEFLGEIFFEIIFAIPKKIADIFANRVENKFLRTFCIVLTYIVFLTILVGICALIIYILYRTFS